MRVVRARDCAGGGDCAEQGEGAGGGGEQDRGTGKEEGRQDETGPRTALILARMEAGGVCAAYWN